MAHEQILKARRLRGLQVLRFGHDGKGADMRATQLRVMAVMMIVRTAPNTAGAQNQDAKHGHEGVGQARMRQDGPMLLVVINDEQPQKQKAGEQTARDLAGKIEVPNRSGHGQRQKKSCGQNVGPTFRCKISGVRFGR